MLDFLWSLDSHGMVGDADGEHLSQKSKCCEKIKQDTLIAWVTIHVMQTSRVCVTLCQMSSVRLDICAGCTGVCGTGLPGYLVLQCSVDSGVFFCDHRTQDREGLAGLIACRHPVALQETAYFIQSALAGFCYFRFQAMLQQ
jgi:hypothetical protein